MHPHTHTHTYQAMCSHTERELRQQNAHNNSTLPQRQPSWPPRRLCETRAIGLHDCCIRPNHRHLSMLAATSFLRPRPARDECVLCMQLSATFTRCGAQSTRVQDTPKNEKRDKNRMACSVICSLTSLNSAEWYTEAHHIGIAHPRAQPGELRYALTCTGQCSVKKSTRNLSRNLSAHTRSQLALARKIENHIVT